MTIFCGNLAFTVTEEELRAAFEPVGKVYEAKVIRDFETGRSRGFGFIKMDRQFGLKAIEELSGTMLAGRELRLEEARPTFTHDRPPRPRTPLNSRWTVDEEKP